MEGINFRFFFDFKSDDTGIIEITEAPKFDGSVFTVIQDKNRYGRDVSFGNEEVSLVFYKGLYDKTLNPLQLPSGTIVYNLTMGLEYLLDYYNNFGSESEVDFIIEKEEFGFTVGELDFQFAKTDLLTFFETKIIQQSERAIINRRKDTKVDVFSPLDLDMNPIEPLATTNILLRAKPVKEISEWGTTPIKNFAGSNIYLNPANLLTTYGIQDSYVPFLPSSSNFQEAGNNFRYLLAREDLSNINIHLETDIDFIYRTDGGDSSNLAFISLNYIIYPYPYEDFPNNSLEQVIVYQKNITGGAAVDFTLPTEFDINIQAIPRGYSLAIFWRMSWDTVHIDNTYWDFKKSDILATATSTAINSVIKGVRYVDLFKQNIKSISGMDLVSPRFDVNGQFYDQFAFNGYGIRQFTDKPFYVTFKELMEDTQEVNGDYQINENEIFLGLYPDFYPNREIAVLLQMPDSEFESGFNERYMLVNAEYKYKTYEKDRDEKNTIDAVHTETQYLFPNRKADGVKKIEVGHIRDPFAIESARRQGINTKETTSLSNDDNLYLIDVVPLEEGSLGGFTASLLQKIEVGEIYTYLKLLNSDGEQNGTFNWGLLGFQDGDSFTILTGSNAGLYSISSIEPTVLTLLKSVGVPTFEGLQSITVSYPLTDVEYQNRTDEGLSLIENLEGGNNFSNLQYTIRRNLRYWESYFKTASKYKPDGTIQNTFFKNNGLLRTQFGAEQIYQENENLVVADLEDAILSPMVYKTKVIVGFEDMVQLLNDLQTVYPDGTVGGFIRIVDTNNRVLKIHPTKLDYEWATNLLSIPNGEARNESDFTTVDNLTPLLITINEVGYDIDILSNEWYKIVGNYVTLFDANSIPIINPTRIEKMKVNGIVYDNAVDLGIALSNL